MAGRKMLDMQLPSIALRCVNWEQLGTIARHLEPLLRCALSLRLRIDVASQGPSRYGID